MRKINYSLILMIFCSFLSMQCDSQVQKNTAENNSTMEETKNRKASVAGSFYPAGKAELSNNLEALFARGKSQIHSNVRALICPHAGYVFSGKVTASACNQIDPAKKYTRIFLIGSSHRVHFNGVSIYSTGHYETPLALAKVDINLAKKLIEENDFITFRADAHLQEHSLEVIIPFLQYKLNNDFKIIPIIIGGHSTEISKKLAEVLKAYFHEDNLFVISTDFSHYPTYEVACELDESTANAVISGNPHTFIHTIEENSRNFKDRVSTSMCGATATLTLMYITENMPGISYHKIDYENSGDSKYGDHERVVGYYAIAVTQENENKKDQGFYLEKKEKIKLLSIARNTLKTYLTDGNIPLIDENDLSPSLKKPCGAFVTLHKNKALRGCIGNFQGTEALYKTVQNMAVSAALKDYRFPPLTKEELEYVDIEISVLSPMKKIKSIDEIELGKHGIYIKAGSRSGTFLPQVARDTQWSKEEFLGHCSRDKAGIGWEGWKNADIFIYEALIFSEEDLL
jgi:MEMO1 family protein